MCGLFGSIGLFPDPARIDIVAHRGPDGRGWQDFSCSSGPVALGHRRLAVIDVSNAGLQPMADATGRFHLVFNGEIYNYIELREELRARGETFVSDSDSEVLLQAYMTWGEDCLSHLRGMFAFLIWDERDKRLFAARDRFGIKPLYFASTESYVAFGSEIKQLLDLPSVTRRMNVPRVFDFLTTGICDHTAETMFEGVRQLRGGECATVEAAATSLRLSLRRWYPASAGHTVLTESAAAEEFRDRLTEAVRLHLRSDVPVGSCLSGGLDSSSIVSLMTNLMPKGQQVNTVSACYAEKAVDEKPFMEAVVAHTGSRAHFIFPKAEEVFGKVRDITWHQDEPFGSTSIFAQWCVFEEARRVGVKVMLDGQGADEQLAGYHSAFPFYLSRLTKKGRLIQLARTMLQRRTIHGVSLTSQLKRYMAAVLPRWIAGPLRRRHAEWSNRDWLGPELLRVHADSEGAMTVATKLVGLESPHDIRSLCLAMTFASNLQMLLHWEDRNSMAHSIEARVPFLDHSLVEFSLALGNEHKVVGADTKRVLRSAMAGVLPEVVRQRRDKLGFATPEESWFRGPLRGLVHDGIETTLRLYPELFDVQGVRRLRDSMLDGSRPVDPLLWRIVSLGVWGQVFNVRM